MKVLIVNWSWYATGGDWTYVENTKKLYELNGFEVIPFSTHNKKNTYSVHSKYFVKSYDFKELNKNKTIANGIKAVRTSIVSTDALAKLDAILAIHDIKFAHINNIHHYITPAIIEKLYKKGIKVIWTLHDYKIICPENSFVSNGKICEKCITGSFYHCTTNKCKKNSYLASALASFEAYYYHNRKTYDLVDYFLCPSNFLLQKFVQFGFDKNKLFESNLCYDISFIDNYITQNIPKLNTYFTKEKYILYVGRLEEIKGIKTLINAVIGTDIQLKIVGSGSAEADLKQLVLDKNATNVEFLGFKNKNEVFELTYHAQFGVCPSEWYENFPFSISETFLFSKPVIGSNIGGIPELVLDNKTGLLFEAGNVLQLKQQLMQLWQNENLCLELGKNAREHAFELYNFNTHWQKLNSIIQKLKLVPNE
jgi:glycosyltransferase involved in cell wall biosynthesis